MDQAEQYRLDYQVGCDCCRCHKAVRMFGERLYRHISQMAANKKDDALGQKFDIFRIVELRYDFLAGRKSLVVVHCELQTVAHHEMLCKSKAPWLHGMCATKVHVLDATIVVEGYGVSFGSFNAICFDLQLDLMLELSPLEFGFVFCIRRRR